MWEAHAKTAVVRQIDVAQTKDATRAAAQGVVGRADDPQAPRTSPDLPAVKDLQGEADPSWNCSQNCL